MGILMNSPQESVYVFKYDGKNNSIDIDTLLNSQCQMKIILEEIQRSVQPEGRIKIRASAISSGSFEIHLSFELIEDLLLLTPLMASESGVIIQNIFKYFSQIIKIKKLLKGKKPENIIEQSGENISIEGNNNNITVNKTSYNLYTENVPINSAIDKNFRSLKADPEINSIEIRSKNKRVFSVKRKEFDALAMPNECLADSDKEEIIETNIAITKPVLNPEKKYKWGFIYQGRYIHADMNDSEFKLKIRNGDIKFGHGDILKVRLKIIREYDRNYATYIEKSFEVIEVLRYYPRPTQTELNY
jgi:hypothetical protein